VVADWSARPGVATLYENDANPPGVRA
jgi:hypothetical protein